MVTYSCVCGLCWICAGLSARAVSQDMYLCVGCLVAWWLGSKIEHVKKIRQKLYWILDLVLEVTNVLSVILTSPFKIKGRGYGMDPTSQWGSINVTLYEKKVG